MVSYLPNNETEENGFGPNIPADQSSPQPVLIYNIAPSNPRTQQPRQFHKLTERQAVEIYTVCCFTIDTKKLEPIFYIQS